MFRTLQGISGVEYVVNTAKAIYYITKHYSAEVELFRALDYDDAEQRAVNNLMTQYAKKTRAMPKRSRDIIQYI